MDEYIKTLQTASNTIWKVFRQCLIEHKNPNMAFGQIVEMYKGTSAETYVTEYTKICTEVMKDAEDPKAYLDEALKVTVESWKVFKKHIGKLYGDEMTDGDWNRLIKDATDVGYKRWTSNVREYAKRYSCLCVEELDRHYRRIHHIREDWEKGIAKGDIHAI